MASQLLKVGKEYQLTTKNETINEVKVKVVGIVDFSETKRIPYSLQVLAVNERVINYQDESKLEDYLKDNNIYHLRALEKNDDGTYSEYLVWDGIIDLKNTTSIDRIYKFEMNIKTNADYDQDINVFIKKLQNYIHTQHAGIDATITYAANENEAANTLLKEQEYKKKLDQALSTIDAFNQLNVEFIPTIKAISSTNLNEKLISILKMIPDIESRISTLTKI